jgi:hypothetical protein
VTGGVQISASRHTVLVDLGAGMRPTGGTGAVGSPLGHELNLYFVSKMPMDFFPSLGIAEIALAVDPKLRTHLLLVGRRPNISATYFSRFTSVHYLPNCSYQKNLKRGLDGVRAFRRVAGEIDVQPNSLYFFYEASEPLAHLLLKERLDRIKNILYVKVSVMTEPFSRRNGAKKLWWRRSLVTSAYSLLLGQRLVRMYVSPVLTQNFLPLYKPYHDADIIIETARSHSVETVGQAFTHMAYPGKFVEQEAEESVPNLADQAVIYFLGLDYCHETIAESQYWSITNRMLALLESRYSGSPLYVKLHPNDDDASLRYLKAPSWRVIRKTISSEELFVRNRRRIRAIYSSSSASSMIAAGFGIPAYVTYPLVHGTGPLRQLMDDYFSPLSDKLFTVREWHDLTNINGPRKSDPRREEGELERWRGCIEALLALVRGGCRE